MVMSGFFVLEENMNEKRMVVVLGGFNLEEVLESLNNAYVPPEHIHLPASEEANLPRWISDLGICFDQDESVPAHVCACGNGAGCCRLRHRVGALLGDPAEVHRHVLNRVDIHNLVRFFASMRIFRNLLVSESLIVPEFVGVEAVAMPNDEWGRDHGVAFDIDPFCTLPGRLAVGGQFVKIGDLDVGFEPARCGFRLGISFRNRRIEPETLLSITRFFTTIRWIRGLRVEATSFTPELAELGVRGDLNAGAGLAVYVSEKPFVKRDQADWAFERVFHHHCSPLISVVLRRNAESEFWHISIRFPNDELLKFKPFGELDY
jgi:hypothetical protein